MIKQGDNVSEEVSRKYTPVSTIFEKGKFELLIKVYFKDIHPKFPLGGKMSQYLNDLKMGESIKVRAPFGKLTYLGDGSFKILTKLKPLTYREKVYKKVGMIAGGTGITPFFQVIIFIKKIKYEFSHFNLKKLIFPRFYRLLRRIKILLISHYYLLIGHLLIFY